MQGKTKHRLRWTAEDLKALSQAYKTYPYSLPGWLIARHGQGGCHSKASKLGFAKGIRHPGLDTSSWCEADKGYIAGFLDGEGSIILYEDRAKPNPAILFPNTHKGVLEFLQSKLTTGSLAITFREKRNPKWKDIYQLHIHGAKQVFDILVALEPYLIIKKEKARNAILLLKEKYNFTN
jgi:hypothetical protein